MFLYYSLYAVCAAITNFNVVFVENLVAFADEVQKVSTAEKRSRHV